MINVSRAQAFAISRVFNRLEVALELTQEDEESLKAVRRLQQLIQDGAGALSMGKQNAGGQESSASQSDPSSSSNSNGRRLPFPLPTPPLGIPLPGFPFLPGGGEGGGRASSALGPREAVEAARQAAGLATLIGPGVLAIARKFLVQLSAR